MILRRIAEALRRQDWSTVFLEIGGAGAAAADASAA